MKLFIVIIFTSVLLLTLVPLHGQGLIIDHYAVKDFEEIPADWLEQAKQVKVHYGHTSHGAQLVVGLGRISDNSSAHNFEHNLGSLPDIEDAFCMFDGTYVNESYQSYVEPMHYWEGEDGKNCTRYVLDNYSGIEVSMFMWCWQMRAGELYYVEEYLVAMEQLEAEYPDVTFIYMTGHSQTYEGHHYYGYLGNNYLRRNQANNDLIRNYCRENNKVLFDFGEIDCWWFDPVAEEWSCSYSNFEGTDYPREHDHYNFDEAGHTTYENCENKGKAVWYMLARIAGWDGGVVEEIDEALRFPDGYSLSNNYPNPFNPSTKIKFNLPAIETVTIAVYNLNGQRVETLINKSMPAGNYEVEFDGQKYSSGVYMYRIDAGEFHDVKKMMLLK